jgi:tRNA G18 (ribose-2'-O)-methylase SpoU
MRKLSNDELGRKSVDEFRVSGKSPFIIVLDNIRSFHNVGSVFRSADAFLVEAVYLCGITGTPPHREIQKTALGATESVHWKYFNTTLEAVDELKNDGFEIISLEQAEGSVSLREFMPESGKKYGLVFGHEINGVAQNVVDKSDHVIEIPQFGTKHSFNISVTAGIVLWDLYNKLD